MKWLRRKQAPPPPPPSPVEILISLIAQDVLRHADRWPEIVKDRKASKDDKYFKIVRKGYVLEFVKYDWHDKFTVHKQDITRGLKITENEAGALADALTKAKAVYDHIQSVHAQLDDIAEDSKRQMLACDAIERFMTSA